MPGITTSLLWTCFVAKRMRLRRSRSFVTRAHQLVRIGVKVDFVPQLALTRLLSRYLPRLRLLRRLVRAAQALRQGRLEELVEVAIQHTVGIARGDAGAEVFHLLVGLEHVGADLVAPAALGLGGAHG